ncbi:hypothetical protein BIWAKO_05873 [Bosea sp. BIWAKO-01]|nr:hypothetical protein BIWAKO_05873 [Bosea sp. BIWAKO-01]
MILALTRSTLAIAALPSSKPRQRQLRAPRAHRPARQPDCPETALSSPNAGLDPVRRRSGARSAPERTGCRREPNARCPSTTIILVAEAAGAFPMSHHCDRRGEGGGGRFRQQSGSGAASAARFDGMQGRVQQGAAYSTGDLRYPAHDGCLCRVPGPERLRPHPKAVMDQGPNGHSWPIAVSAVPCLFTGQSISTSIPAYAKERYSTRSFGYGRRRVLQPSFQYAGRWYLVAVVFVADGLPNRDDRRRAIDDRRLWVFARAELDGSATHGDRGAA